MNSSTLPIIAPQSRHRIVVSDHLKRRQIALSLCIKGSQIYQNVIHIYKTKSLVHFDPLIG